MARQVALFLVAVQFLTRVPVPTVKEFQPDWTARSARYFSLVGGLVGLVTAGMFLIASGVWSGPVPALLALTVGVLLTGAFHEDGLADTFDGLGGGQSRERRLEIMKDSRIGTFGMLGLGLTLALKAAALTQTPVWLGAVGLIAAHAGGRAAAVVAMRLLPYAGDRDQTKVKPTADGVSGGEALAAVLLAAAAWAPLGLGAPGAALAALVVGGALAALMAAAAARLIGGWVGDTLGATEQMFEAGVLIALAAAVASA